MRMVRSGARGCFHFKNNCISSYIPSIPILEIDIVRLPLIFESDDHSDVKLKTSQALLYI